MNYNPSQYGSAVAIIGAIATVLQPVGDVVQGVFTKKGMEAQAEATTEAAWVNNLGAKASTAITSAYAPVYITGGIMVVGAITLGVIALSRRKK